MAQYLKKLVTCMDCSKDHFQMVRNGKKEKFIFRCRDCTDLGIPMFGRKR